MLLLINPDKTSNMKQNTLKVIGAIILLINISLLGYKNYNDIDIGRYVPMEYSDNYKYGILDTKTGLIYCMYKDKSRAIKLNLIEGKVSGKPLK